MKAIEIVFQLFCFTSWSSLCFKVKSDAKIIMIIIIIIIIIMLTTYPPSRPSVYYYSQLLLPIITIINNYSPKAKLILLNHPRDEVLIYSHEVISTESERKPLKND